MENALVHHAGDIRLLSEQITLLDTNRDYLLKLREASLRTASEITWLAAGYKLAEVYSQVLDQTRRDRRKEYRSGTVRDDVQIGGRSVQTVA
jgi:hypothetical protein